MLQGIDIVNYQTHRSSSFEFHPGMNVITGISSNGKTAIIRAIIWALTGRPMGDSFKSWGASEKDNVEVSLDFDTGWFTKSRIKDKNQYTCDAGKFEALRADVPEVIHKIANLTDYNLMTQHEPFFMLQMSPGDRAKKLNDLVGLSIMDTVIKKLNSKVTKAKSSITGVTDQINTLTYELEGMQYLDSVAPQIQKIDDDINKYEVNVLRIDLMLTLRNKLQEIEAQIKSYDKVLALEPKYFDLMLKIKDYQDKDTAYGHLLSIKDQLTVIEESTEHWLRTLEKEQPYISLKNKVNTFKIKETELTELKETHKSLKSITEDLQADLDWLTVEEPYRKLFLKIATFKTNWELHKNMTYWVNKLKEVNNQIDEGNLELIHNVNHYTKLLEKSGTCPTCMTKVGIATMKQIKSKLLED